MMWIAYLIGMLSLSALGSSEPPASGGDLLPCAVPGVRRVLRLLVTIEGSAGELYLDFRLGPPLTLMDSLALFIDNETGISVRLIKFAHASWSRIASPGVVTCCALSLISVSKSSCQS